MKVKDVPQDMKYYEGSHARDINYAVDEEGRYKAVVSCGWEAKTDALDAAWDEVNDECQEVLERIRKGETSALEYHATKNLMTLSLLSTYTGFSKRTIKKHYDPKVFASLDDETLAVYAEALRITVEELKSIPE